MKEIAQGLASLGRGPDTQLVHMAPSEVRGLQSLAKAHGGSLTINPDTGLPEAGFLSSILPMVIGAGLIAATGGAAAPLVAGMSNAAVIGLGVGGIQTLRTGSLSKGMMAGLGAYGGAGLGAGLMSAGATGTAAEMAGGLSGASPGELAAAQQGAASGAGQTFGQNLGQMGQGASNMVTDTGARSAFMSNIGGGKGLAMTGLAAASPMMVPTVTQQPEIKTDKDMGQRYTYSPGVVGPTPIPDVPGYGAQDRNFGKEQTYYKPQYNKVSNEAARSVYGYANGGPIEDMSNANVIGANTSYPQAGIRTAAYASPYQRPTSENMVTGAQDVAVDPYTGQEQRTSPAPQAQFADGGDVGGYKFNPATQSYSGGAPLSGEQEGRGLTAILDRLNQRYNTIFPQEASAIGTAPQQYANGSRGGFTFNPATRQYTKQEVSPEYLAYQAAQEAAANQASQDPGHGGGMANGGMAQGGISDLGSYSDGGRLLRGPGDGISDSIPAVIGKKRPARLADGEFVVPARIVSELGNGSTEAGARQLYAMMDRVQKSRGKTVGKGKVAANSRAAKYLPA